MSKYWIALRRIVKTLDTYKWPPTHPFFTCGTTEQERNRLLALRLDNKKKLLTYGPEVAGIVTNCILYKSKSYSLESVDSMGDITHKLTMKGAVKSMLDYKHLDLLRFLLSDKFSLLYTHRSIMSKQHEMMLKVSKKTVVNKYYDKRYVFPNNNNIGIASLSYGHYFIEIYKETEECINDLLDIVELIENDV